MASVRRNVIANVCGRGWSAILSFAVVPFYLRILGVETYGLIGVFMSLIAIFGLFDLGLGNALNRRLAQLSVDAGREQEMSDLLRTLEVIYWLMGILIGTIIFFLAPLVARYWIQPEQLSVETATMGLTLMGVAIACQWPKALYTSGLVGMQSQVVLNITSSLMQTVLNVGGVIVIWLVAPTIQALMTWYIVVGLVESLIMAVLLRRRLPHAPEHGKFRAQVLSSIWRFAAGMTGISVLAVILTQLDKVILSKMLSLEEFGIYTLAWRVASGIYYLVSPVTTAFFPRFSQLVALHDERELARLYHRGSQLLAAVVVPVAVILVIFPTDFVRLWTGDVELAAKTGALLGLLAAGTALNGLMNMPLLLQLAYGWTRLVFFTNLVAVLLLAPLIYLSSLRYGGIGAGWVWLGLNAGYLVFLVQMMHRRLLPGHLRHWYIFDLGMPLAAAVGVAGSWNMLIASPVSHTGMAINLGAVSFLTLCASVAAVPEIRRSLTGYLFRLSGVKR